MKITMTNIDDRNEIYTTEEDRGEYMTLTSVGDYVSLMVPAPARRERNSCQTYRTKHH